MDFDWTGSGRGNHVEFERQERIPLHQGRFLGQGMNGPVYETKCKDYVVAWKQKFCRGQITRKDLKELKILKALPCKSGST